MTEFTPAKIDKVYLILCAPAVLVIIFASHAVAALLWGLFCAMFALARLILKRLPKPPHHVHPSLVKHASKPIFHLVSHARMSRYQWDALNTREKRPEDLWAEIKRIYHLEDRYVKFTANGWIDHINWNGQHQKAGSRPDVDGDVFLYFYTVPEAPVEPEVVALPAIPETDDIRWARMYRENPLAYWLDPNLWSKVGYAPADFTKLAIELDKANIGYLPGDKVETTVAYDEPRLCHWACHPYDSAAYSRCDNKCGHAPAWAGTKNAKAYPK